MDILSKRISNWLKGLMGLTGLMWDEAYLPTIFWGMVAVVCFLKGMRWI